MDNGVSRAIDMTASTLTASLSQSPIRTVLPGKRPAPASPLAPGGSGVTSQTAQACKYTSPLSRALLSTACA